MEKRSKEVEKRESSSRVTGKYRFGSGGGEGGGFIASTHTLSC